MKSKIILNPTIARKLLHIGHIIIDIKPKKENPKESVFVFKLTNKLNEDLNKIINR